MPLNKRSRLVEKGKDYEIYENRDGTRTIILFQKGDPDPEATVYSEKDAHVMEDYPNDNTGNLSFLDTGYYNPPSERQIWLGFDFSVIPNGMQVLSATLSLYLNYWWITATREIGAYHSDDDTWTELGITWNNKPSRNANPTSTLNINYGSGYKNWNVLSDVQADYLGNKKSTWCMRYLTNPGIRCIKRFDSRQGTNKPKLVITYQSLLIWSNKDQQTQVTPQFTLYQDQLVSLLPRLQDYRDQLVSILPRWVFTDQPNRVQPEFTSRIDQSIQVTPLWVFNDQTLQISPWAPVDQNVAVTAQIWMKDQRVQVTPQFFYADQKAKLSPRLINRKHQLVQINPLISLQDQDATILPYFLTHSHQAASVTPAIGLRDQALSFLPRFDWPTHVPIREKRVSALPLFTVLCDQTSSIFACYPYKDQLLHLGVEHWTVEQTVKVSTPITWIPEVGDQEVALGAGCWTLEKTIQVNVGETREKAVSVTVEGWFTGTDQTVSILPLLDFGDQLVQVIYPEAYRDKVCTVTSFILAKDLTVKVSPRWVFQEQTCQVIPQFIPTIDQQIQILADWLIGEKVVCLIPLYSYQKDQQVQILALIPLDHLVQILPELSNSDDQTVEVTPNRNAEQLISILPQFTETKDQLIVTYTFEAVAFQLDVKNNSLVLISKREGLQLIVRNNLITLKIVQRKG